MQLLTLTGDQMPECLMPLGHRMDLCPQAWQNFIEDLADSPPDLRGDISILVINQGLAPFHAQWCTNIDGTDAIKFASEQDYLMFLLRWA